MQELRPASPLTEFGRALLLSIGGTGALAGIIPGLLAFSALDAPGYELQAASVWLPAVLSPLFFVISIMHRSKTTALDLSGPGIAAAFGLANMWHCLSIMSGGFVIG